MPFPTKHDSPPVVKPETFAICLLLTCSLQIMENLLPKIPIFPWLRIGLAYWVLLPFLIRFGVIQALFLFLFRNLMTLIYGGQVFSSFLISTSAGLVSILVIGTMGRFLFNRNKIGLIGLSVLLACSFNVSQLVVVDQLLIRHQEFYFQLAPILIWSLVSGALIALLVYKSQPTLEHLFAMDISLPQSKPSSNSPVVPASSSLYALLALSGFSSIFLFEDIIVQLVYLPVLVLIARIRNLKLLIHAWPFYFYIAWLHLFRTDGVYILGQWITKEGWDAFLFYAVRTTNIILCGQWVARYIPSLLRRIKNNRFLEGAGFALPLLPSIFGISIALGKDLFGKVKAKEFQNLLDPVVERMLAEFNKLEGIRSVPSN
jgi:uncharacterized membrane protein